MDRFPASARDFLGQSVTIRIDRPLGSRHPQHAFIYPLNYGFVEGVILPGGDGEPLDAYLLGVFEPVEQFTGICIAYLHRQDDNDDKLIIVPPGVNYTNEQIAALTEFQERFFSSTIIRGRTSPAAIECNRAMTFRLAVEEDLPQLAELRWAFRTELRPPAGVIPLKPVLPREVFLPACLEFLQRGLASGYWAFWVAEEDGEIISQVCIQKIDKIPRPIDLHPQMGYITNVYTRPAYRNQGIGAKLMTLASDWARSEGLESLVLWPAKGREAFYERAGFNPSHALEQDLQD